MLPSTLPIFPLPLVLFPSAPLPLHIFEPRYREMIADCESGDGRFGVILATGGPEHEPRGRVGCVAALRDVRRLPDGRSNVLVEGLERFAFERFVDTPHAYHVAAIAPYDDAADEDPSELARAAARVRSAFTQIADAARTIADDGAPVPALPASPEQLAFGVASLVDFDRLAQQALLASRSPLARLRDVETLLRGATPGVRARAETHERAKSNGHGPMHDAASS